jgi:OOP family OmpA-OmpF porin
MKTVAIAISAMFFSSVSFLLHANPYIGLGVGSTDYKVDLSNISGGSFEDNSTGTKIYGGYVFNKYYAAEVAYYNFAEASVGAREISPGGPVVGGAADMKGFGAYAVGMYPVSKSVNLMAKIGILNWDADLSVNNAFGNDASGTNDGTDLAYAIAMSYGFTKELLVVAEWESFDTDNPEVSLLSVGFKFIFK